MERPGYLKRSQKTWWTVALMAFDQHSGSECHPLRDDGLKVVRKQSVASVPASFTGLNAVAGLVMW